VAVLGGGRAEDGSGGVGVVFDKDRNKGEIEMDMHVAMMMRESAENRIREILEDLAKELKPSRMRASVSIQTIKEHDTYLGTHRPICYRVDVDIDASI